MSLLAGGRAVVTGGGSGIGRATCHRLAAAGAAVAVLDIDGDSAKDTAAEVSGLAVAVDVTDAEALRQAVDDAAAQLGGLSILVNNAGGSTMVGLADWDPDEWDRIVRLNLTGVFNGMRAGVPHLLAAGGGAVVNTASISATRPSAGETPYSAAKAGVIALTASAALEYGPVIRVNAVAPGMIRTNLTRPLLEIVPDADAHYRAHDPGGARGRARGRGRRRAVPVLGPGPLHHGTDARSGRRHDPARCGGRRPLRPVLPGRAPPSAVS